MMKRRYTIAISFFFILIVLTVGQAMSAGTATVSPGYEAYDEALIGVQFRSFANTKGEEIYVGVPDFNGKSKRADVDFNWWIINDVSFTFDPQQDKLIASVSNYYETTSIEYTDVSTTLVNEGFTYTLDDLNVMQITLSNKDKNGHLIFANVVLDGQTLGSFSEDDLNDWMVTGLDFSEGFTLSGTIYALGSFGKNQEKAHVEIKVGHSASIPTTPTPTNTPVPPTNTPIPTATNTPIPTATNTPVPTNTATAVPTNTPTNTPIPTATNTPIPTATNTPVPTNTATADPTTTPTNTPIPTATNPPVPTSTAPAAPTHTTTNTPASSEQPRVGKESRSRR
ncbi:MAG: hypothetical protein GY943_12805, partial [Chloroflexi bacterium]|nr:hypothetical protein [Chloroflexota bacterium]